MCVSLIRMRIHLYSIHGLFRGKNLEIGKDSDNGGQIIYVMELAKELSQRPEVEHVHLFTRRIDDKQLSPDYAVEIEPINDKFDIRRIPCGGKKYLPKEKLWDCLDEFVSNTLKHIKSKNIFPSWLHSHYADAGYVVSELSRYLNVPYVHSAHSLGMPKLHKLIEAGMTEEEAYERYRFQNRFDAEEQTLASAEFIVTSTENEINLFEDYENFDLTEFHVVSPGINLKRFWPYYEEEFDGQPLTDQQKQARMMAKSGIDKFLSQPDKPFILAICRPDRKKNISGLIHAYGTDHELQSIANLVIYAGIRSDIDHLPSGEQAVLTEILLLMDKYNLYGKLAIPKKHDTDLEVPEIYRLCARQKGVFSNVALTEQFGLTILEATSCGCPVVTTNHGGPAEIVPTCQNGFVVNPYNTDEIRATLKKALINDEQWMELSNQGIRNIHTHYSWKSHVDKYLRLIKSTMEDSKESGNKQVPKNTRIQKRLATAKKMLISDIDGTLISESENYEGLDELRKLLEDRGDQFVFGVATGRSLEKIREILSEHHMPTPDVVISSVGSYIYYGLSEANLDKGWHKHIHYRWNREKIVEAVSSVKGVKEQEPENQNPFKISYYIYEEGYDENELKEALAPFSRRLNVMTTRGAYLDILPRRGSKGRAVRYISQKWSIPLSQTLVCGDSGNDLDMISNTSKAIVVGNHAKELEHLRGSRKVYFADKESSAGILEGLNHYGF